MIIEQILRGLGAMFAGILDLLPSWSVPAFVSGSGVGTLSGYSAAMGAFLPPFYMWVPLPLLVVLIPIMLGAMLASFGIRSVLFIIRLIRG